MWHLLRNLPATRTVSICHIKTIGTSLAREGFLLPIKVLTFPLPCGGIRAGVLRFRHSGVAAWREAADFQYDGAAPLPMLQLHGQ
ncbi:hypothetical protein GCM10027027_11250 [Neomicrococcus lactis]|uniref:Uncharacterized protein n=1 Tax=Neomicrococcus lactis TaxID=732241 RepID=A0A7W8Y8U6_9MICC|nr:hypothetical protein [Neomicrococcus lactis]